ncbi:MAG TPA: ABC transporter permease [Acidimicrobiales bacterium]|nr:ABC transporter permease [Acidimicrobiales bacterium]
MSVAGSTMVEDPGTAAADAPAARTSSLLRAWDGRGIGLVAVAVFVGLWQWYGDSYPHALYLFSTPSAVATAFGHIVASAELPRAFADSVAEEVVGFAIAAVLGIAVGLAMGSLRFVEMSLDPLVTIGIATPVVVLLPVMEDWFGFGYVARVAFITVLSVWPILLNSWIGVRNVSSTYHLVSRALTLGRRQRVWKVVLPAAAPYIFVGLRLGLAMATLGMVLAGQEVGDAGLGGLTEIFGQKGLVGALIAAILSATGLAFLLFWLLRVAEERLFPWIRETSGSR